MKKVVIFNHVNLGLEMTFMSLGCFEIFKLAYKRLCSQDLRSQSRSRLWFFSCGQRHRQWLACLAAIASESSV